MFRNLLTLHSAELSTMQTCGPQKILWLSNVYDEHYAAERGEPIFPCLSSAKRRDLFRCAEAATGMPVVVLSSPPKATLRRKGKWLPPVVTKFSNHTQFVCGNWDAPKIRIPLSWFFYARQALRHAQRGDVVVIDNYELIYVIAAWCLRLFRGTKLVLDYEDGKHAIDRSWQKMLSSLAECLGRPLVRAAFLTHPALNERLPCGTPVELVPGFFVPSGIPKKARDATRLQFLYSGSLDATRGVDVLLGTLPLLPAKDWHLHVTGAGPLEAEVRSAANDSRWRDKMTFHGSVSNRAFQELARACDVGLNCQKISDPISAVTFPSKIFTYLSSELVVISSRASQVDKVCRDACIYYEQDDPQALAAIMTAALGDFDQFRKRVRWEEVRQRYSMEGSAKRLHRVLLGQAP